MTITKLFKKIMGINPQGIVDAQGVQVGFDARYNAAFLALDEVVTQEVVPMLQQSNGIKYAQNKGDYRMIIKMSVLGTLLTLSSINAEIESKKAMVEGVDDEVVWKKVQELFDPLVHTIERDDATPSP